jgi:hypothetical protein
MAKLYSNLPFGSAGSGRFQETVDISGGDYTCPAASKPYIRGIAVNVSGFVVGRLIDDDVDSTWLINAGMDRGLVFAIIRQTGTTATGIKLIG